MADVRFCVGFSSACKQAREGGGLPGYEGRTSRGRCLRPVLPPDIIRLIDALVRRLEHEETLLSMNRGDLGWTLCEAAAAGGLRDVRFLLARGADVETLTNNDDMEWGEDEEWTALRWSALEGHLEVCVALLDAGAVDLDQSLRYSSYAGHTPVVALLLDRGAAVDFDNDKPLIFASIGGHLATVTLLLDRGAHLHARDDRSLECAAFNGHFEVLRLLLDRGANINPVGNPAAVLRSAAQTGHLDITRFLLDQGADIHAEDDRALMACVEMDELEAVTLLLDRGANIHANNEFALQSARQYGHAAIVALLLERGALEPA